MQGFTHIFSESEKNYEDDIDFTKFMSLKKVYSFILPHNTPVHDHVLLIGKSKNPDLFEKYRKVPKPALGYTKEVPYQEIDVNDGNHINMSVIIFSHVQTYDHIVEIGGGYGNIIRINEPVIPYKKWTIIDLPFVGKLQRWYLDTVLQEPSKINIVSAYEYENWSKDHEYFDLTIATHSLSELSWENYHKYFDLILKKSKWFFYATHDWNCGKELLHRKLEHLQTIFDIIYMANAENEYVFNILYRNKHMV